MLKIRLRYNWKKNPLLLIYVIASLGLIILGIFLSSQIGVLKKKNLQNMTTLNQVLPGFSDKSAGQLGEEIKALKLQLVDLFNSFDPKEGWIKKDYDLTIYFVEELGKVNEFLKLKAQDKGVIYPNLGFSEKLPSQAEADYLLSQLYGLKEVISLGMDYGINFTSINPNIGAAEELEGLWGVKLVRSRVELISPAPSLIEFIIELTQTVPVVSIESILLNFQDSSSKINLMLGHVVIPPTLLDVLKPFELAQNDQIQIAPIVKRLSLEEQNFIHILRNNNPFFVAKPKEITAVATGAPDTQKQVSRFFYRGKAILKSKEVIVIEDALNKEVRFSTLGERIGDYKLVSAEDDKIILKKIDTKEEIIVEREK